MVCGHHRHSQLQQLTDDVDIDAAASAHLHQASCYHSATKCGTHYDQSSACDGRTHKAASSPAHFVIDALRTSSDDPGRRLQLPTSQITCRILQPPMAVQHSPAAHTTAKRKIIIPASADKRWTSARTALTNGDCRSDRLLTTTQRLLPTVYRHGDPNGNTLT